MPPAVKRLTAGFERHPVNDRCLPEKRVLRGRIPGALAEANVSVEGGCIAIPVVDAMECAFSTSECMELRTLADAMSRPDAASWVAAALAEIEAHLDNGTWELAQLLPGRRAIGSL